MKKYIIFLRIAVKRESLLPALILSMVVGSLLNLINQYDIIVTLSWYQMNLSKVILTFLIPFFVSLYSATSARMKFRPGEISLIDTVVECPHCGHKEHLRRYRPIPFCPHCRENTKWRIPG